MKAVKLLAIATTAALLTGCSMNGANDAADPKQRVMDAKDRTQQFELRVAKLVPENDVSQVTQLGQGSLQSCESGEMWAGGVTIQLRSGVEPEAVLNDLRASARTAGLEVGSSKAFGGAQRVTVTSKGGISILVDATERSLEGGSFSECFNLPEDFYRGGAF
ncbi:hypothetical protein [Curtobacterium sp. VKM Ac-1395]|uniref:hypothetical protein n=1 Tax=Curtobacterium sp. VKM Ac-1395 TaxID=2783815 RepID=UPI00188AB980|nr:hypothetical protein [Curtobacterium sp. VKM Ac-1395]MBF4591617.1 hypothetical protein [Curtobacterium sp. VKM Ac-1395]